MQATWTGADVPAGTASAAIPGLMTIVGPPTRISRRQPFYLYFNSQSETESYVRLIASDRSGGSPRIIECIVPAADHEVLIPDTLNKLLPISGTVDVLVSSIGFVRQKLGVFQVDVRVHGPVDGQQAFTLEITD